jgi:hypothetical protein
MNTTNRGSRQSEYQRSIAGAGNVRSGSEERYGGGSSGASRQNAWGRWRGQPGLRPGRVLTIRQPLGGGNGARLGANVRYLWASR